MCRAERSGDSLLLQCPWRLLARESYGWTSARSRRETCGLGPPCLVKFVRIVREAVAFSGLLR